MKTLTHVALVSTLAFAAGCVGTIEQDTGEQAQTQKEGLTILRADVNGGVSGVYREGARVVLFETFRTIVTTPDPTWPTYDSLGVPVDVSARFTDTEGRGLYTALGSGAPAAWAHGDAEDAAFTLAELKARKELFLVASRASEALAKVSMPERLEPERKILVQVAEALAFNPAAEATDTPVMDGQPAQTITGYREYFELRSSGVGGAHVCSRWQYQYYEGGWWGAGWIDNRNHGGDICLRDASLYCNRNTATRSSSSTYRNSTRDCDYSTSCNNAGSGCSYGSNHSSYYSNYCVLGMDCHNCRTDSAVQRAWVVSRSDVRSAQCFGPHGDAPGC